MSLDVYVMPLWRFKAGDVETAAERLLGRESRMVTLAGVLRRNPIKGFLGRRRARQKCGGLWLKRKQR